MKGSSLGMGLAGSSHFCLGYSFPRLSTICGFIIRRERVGEISSSGSCLFFPSSCQNKSSHPHPSFGTQSFSKTSRFLSSSHPSNIRPCGDSQLSPTFLGPVGIYGIRRWKALAYLPHAPVTWTLCCPGQKGVSLPSACDPEPGPMAPAPSRTSRFNVGQRSP